MEHAVARTIVGRTVALFFIAVTVSVGWRELKAGLIGLRFDLSIQHRPEAYWFWRSGLCFVIAGAIVYFVFIR